MQVLSDLQAEQLCGGGQGGVMASLRSQQGGKGLGRFSAIGLLSYQTITNTIDQSNFAINIAVNGGTIINTQINALSMETII